MNPLLIRKQLEAFLNEDLCWGDLTTDALLKDETAEAVILAKEEGLMAGGPFVAELFNLLGPTEVKLLKKEGESFKSGDELVYLKGSAANLLKTERTALNLLQRLCGVATAARRLVKALEGTGVKLLDTRKTTPGLRLFEKYAARVGGALNHRFCLSDAVLIKDNHKKLVGGVRQAVKLVRERVSPVYKVEVEVESLDELVEALEAGADAVMLDNFSPEEVKEALKLVKGKVLVEVSGSVTPENARLYALKGVDFISSGYPTRRAQALDLSLEVL
ncbi:MAG: carboxylating nicotinate-nucleotide diphosphorylase [Aquificae bacterium]|nr:carboxylating nicotinate-nucleotide diphosphorylase [Aquificota bacterium]